MTELVQLTEHPAPWPHRDLDVAAMRARGHEPVPFRQFILKANQFLQRLGIRTCSFPDLPRSQSRLWTYPRFVGALTRV